MKALLLHPADDPIAGPWICQPWSQVFDLGWAGEDSYRRWQERLNSTVGPLEKIGGQQFEEIRAAMACGSGFLLDQQGLDWWDLIALDLHQNLEEILRLQSLAARLAPEDEVWVTRGCFETRALELILQRPIRRFRTGNYISRKIRHYSNAIRKLSVSQLMEIAGDKYDTSYSFRKFLAPRPKPSSRPLILLPSAYVNVSRTELQYAEMLPESDFLLVATRHSGWMARPPANVLVEKLASYVHGDESRREVVTLLSKWEHLKRSLMSNPLLSILVRSGALDGVPRLLQHGTSIRDAWLRVFDCQPISAVLCADDGNRFTKIPLLIAAHRGLPAIACHHGALDGRHRYRPKQEYIFLSKGRMERDYMIRICGVPAEDVEIGAPRRREHIPQDPRGRKVSIVFFSEPYEVLGARCREIYAEILPALATVAVSLNCRLVIKLHPFESRREREELAKDALCAQPQCDVQIVDGPLNNELLDEALCAVTILSTTAVDCTLRSIPVFLCAWLDYSRHGYLQQFAKFGAGIAVKCSADLSRIPGMLEDFVPKGTSDLYEPITPERLRSLLSNCASMAMAV